MDETYDVVICGTGLIECILSGLLSQEGKQVLHIDRNPFYGGEGASVNLTNLWGIFREGKEAPQEYGQNRDWNIDLIPKYIMSNGKLVKILLLTRVAQYLEWKSIDGTYVYQMKEGGMFSKGGPKIEKVPANDKEALKSDLMGLFEKNRCKNFFQFIQNYDPKDPKTHKDFDLKKVPFETILKKYDLEPNTIDFIGHAIALYTNDNFLKMPAVDVIEKILLYMDSIGRYGDSPFIYPVYGLGGIPEGFSRMCAIHGGTFMLKTDIDQVLFDDATKQVVGVKSGDVVTKCKMVICDPSYAVRCGLKDRVKSIGKVIRCICFLNHTIPNTHDVPSVQIILPQRQTGRKNDIYIMMVSNVHNVCKQGMYVAIISTIVETNNPEKEIQPALDLIGSVLERFVTVSDLYVPVVDNKDGLWISNSMDPTSHFENQTENVLNLYKKITGKDLDLTKLPEDTEDQ